MNNINHEQKYRLCLDFLFHDQTNTQITIVASVDKGWIVIWITVVDQVGLAELLKIEYRLCPGLGCHQAPASYFLSATLVVCQRWKFHRVFQPEPGQGLYSMSVYGN